MIRRRVNLRLLSHRSHVRARQVRRSAPARRNVYFSRLVEDVLGAIIGFALVAFIIYCFVKGWGTV